ncbi:unnamed protein product [Orchesella dallaii]|uniref:Uncharacterized protein n=1 Tax=Orchesella dallaii TaxID=48710 RepID=A0ABP1R727_9HEXA
MSDFLSSEFGFPNSTYPDEIQQPRQTPRASSYEHSSLNGLQHSSGFRATPVETFGNGSNSYGSRSTFAVGSRYATPYSNELQPPVTTDENEGHDFYRPRPMYTPSGARGGWSTPHPTINPTWMPQSFGSLPPQEAIGTTQETEQRERISTPRPGSTSPLVNLEFMPIPRALEYGTQTRGGRVTSEEEDSEDSNGFDLSKVKTESVTPPLYLGEGTEMEVQRISVLSNRAPTGNGIESEDEGASATGDTTLANQYTPGAQTGSGQSQVVPYRPLATDVIVFGNNNTREYAGPGSAELGQYPFQNLNTQQSWRSSYQPRPLTPGLYPHGHSQRSTSFSFGNEYPQLNQPETTVELNPRPTYSFNSHQEPGFQQQQGGHYHLTRNGRQAPTPMNRFRTRGSTSASETTVQRMMRTLTDLQEAVTAQCCAPCQANSDMPPETFKRAKTEPPHFTWMHCATCTCDVD